YLAMELAKSFEWGINPRFTSYNKYSTAEQANQIASSAIAQKTSVNDFGKSRSQQPLQTLNQTTDSSQSSREQEINSNQTQNSTKPYPRKRIKLVPT
ncbi:MAG: hypothetical protein AAGM40_26890, partial [Cyanobacteria bacterium J06573_2]